MSDIGTRKFNYSLEGLRGICAITVALAHVQTGMILIPGSNRILEYCHFAHLAVLVFFMLSGYVIGVNYPKDSFGKKKDIADYLIKRFFRIYPIYLIIILFCFAIEPRLSVSKVLGAVFLFQGWTQGLETNVVLWSIHYEIIFYLTFIFINKKKNVLPFEIAFCIILSVIVWVTPGMPQILGGYFCGFGFWLTGLYISKIRIPSAPERNSKYALICLLFLVMVYNNLAPGGILIKGIGLKNNNADIVSFGDVFNLIPCFLFIVEAGNIYIRKQLLNTLYVMAIGLPAVVFGYLLYTGRLSVHDIFQMGRLADTLRWALSLLFLGIAVIFFLLKQPRHLLEKIAFLGGISYSIYIIHWPLGYLMGRIYAPTQLWLQITYFIFWLALVLAVSWLLEKKFQIFLKRRFFPYKPTIPKKNLQEFNARHPE